MESRIIWWFLKGLSWIPDSVLRLLSKGIYYFVYRLLGYRKAVVRENLERSFPSLSAESYLEIERKFYHQFSEILTEIIGLVRLKSKTSPRSLCVIQPELLQDYLKKGQNLVIMAGHYGNWELITLSLLANGYRVLAVYKPQSSQPATDLMNRIRQKPGLTLIPMKETIRAVRMEQDHSGSPFCLLLVADQIPARGDIHFWTRFLNQDTAFFTGGEKIALRFKMPALYFDQHKTSYGRYEGSLKVLYDGHEDLPEHAMTSRFASLLEASIIREPHLWLWTHRRWKYGKENVLLNDAKG
ncbi:MAG: lysophospholipid acyltransferase family protein [Bacteroidota bacterium]